MANENLIFRKGLQANLADTTKCPIRPGAISITIDEPGMYIDLPANAALGHADDYRIRIGDVISVYGLKDLAALAAEDKITANDLSTESATSTNTLKGKINKYSSSALYYVLEQNMLLKYNSQTEKFIWINDTSSLQEQITALSGTVGQHTTKIGVLEEKVGSANTNTSGDSNATGLYKIIEETEAGLQEQIASILGGGNGLTLESLDQAIKDEAKTRKEEDDKLDEKISGLNTRLTTAEGNITDINNLIGSDGDTTNSTVYGAIYVEQERAKKAEEDLDKRLDDIEALKIDETYARKTVVESLTNNVVNPLVALVGDEKDEANEKTVFGYIAAEKSRAEGIEGNHENRIAAIEGLGIATNYATKKELSDLATGAVATNTQNITNLNNNLRDNYYKTTQVYNKDEIDGKLGTIPANTNVAAMIAKAQSDAQDHAQTQLNTFKTDVYAVDKQNMSQEISGLANSKADKSTTYTKTEVNDLISGINNTINGLDELWAADIDTAVKAEAAAREAAINGTDGVATKLAAHIESAAKTYETITNVTNKVNAAIETAAGDATSKANKALEDANKYTDGKDTKVREDFAKADGLINEALQALSGNLSNNYYNKKDAADLMDSKDAAILDLAKQFTTDQLGLAEAMKYMGTVTGGTDTDIQNAIAAKKNVEAGHVYVVSNYTGTFHPGDLLIAAKDGSGTDNKLAWSTTNWHHVKTGYNANLEQKFYSTVDNATATDSKHKNGGTLELDSIGALDTGSITFKADGTFDSAKKEWSYNSAVRVTMNADNPNKAVATIGMVWEDF